MREDDLLNWIYDQPGYGKEVLIGPGDDMGMVSFDRDRLLVATDQVLDGVHIQLAEHGGWAAGRKAMCRNLSDIAAMAALPVAAVATVALPKGADDQLGHDIYAGLREMGDAFECPLIGGDIATWDQRLAISVSVLAKPAGATGGITPVTRRGGRGGNVLCVTGQLGGAWHAGRDRTAIPRVREAIVLALRYKLRAMIDLSDGLAKDLARLCQASGVGAELDAAAIPIHPDAAAGREIDPLSAALGDGEDYELLFAIPRGQARRIEADDKLPLPVRCIGRLTREPGLQLIHEDGSRRDLTPAGWEHTS